MEWLEESEKSLDSDLEIANDPDKIKMQLAQHKVSHDTQNAQRNVGKSFSLVLFHHQRSRFVASLQWGVYSHEVNYGVLTGCD